MKYAHDYLLNDHEAFAQWLSEQSEEWRAMGSLPGLCPLAKYLHQKWNDSTLRVQLDRYECRDYRNDRWQLLMPPWACAYSEAVSQIPHQLTKHEALRVYQEVIHEQALKSSV
jgi:hypothetical protein